ncbi:MAG: LptA/OstA family protein [Candidatus Gastranaerophilales bacterium]|nr:LptA/OstA family protein [Candidatus Gastranaerophilales bacterium]
MKKIIILLCILFSTIGFAFATDLTIESEKQNFSEQAHKIFLEGGVKVKFGDIHLFSPRAEVDIDSETKKAKTVNFLDNAYSYQVKGKKKQEVKAQIIEMSLLNKTITAKGNAQSTITENQKPTIIVTADIQEYNDKTNSVKATGGVIVYYKDTQAFGETGIVDVTKNNDIKRIQLIGNASVKQKDNKITAHRINYDAVREEATATGNVFTDINNDEKSKIKVWSNFQMYNKKSNIMVASGHTIIKYKEYTATGPKASVFPDKKTNKLNEVVFVGRSKIEQEGRTIEADRIQLTMEPKNFSAEGNVRTYIPNVQSAEE